MMPISPAVGDNLDDRLLGHFQESWERQDEARRVLPAKWLADSRPAAQQLNELFLDLIAAARKRVADEREALEQRRMTVGEFRD